jgi:ATP/maltotriose-dependent transcriptional regulator MalT
VPPDPKVEAWLASNTAEPLVVDGPRGRLGIRRVQTCDGDRWNALLLDEQGVRPPTLESLCSLGLTKREGQVLRLLSCGKRNQQIAQELFISAATVRKHLEHIYTKLGVATRSEAVARALSRGGDHK